MDTPFRNDVDALKTRLASLDEEVVSLRAKAREYATVQERLEELEREAAEVRREVDARSVRRVAPYLDTLRVASPCHERWEDMVGDERSRFCGKCQKDVHNVSALTRDEAEAFLESVAGSVCVRMYQRSDGTVLTADCPVGVQRKRVKRLFLATVGGGLVAAAGALAFWRVEETTVMGQMESLPHPHDEAGVTPTAPAPSFATPPDTTAPRTTLGVMPYRGPATQTPKVTQPPKVTAPLPVREIKGRM